MTQLTRSPDLRPVEAVSVIDTTGELQDVAESGPASGEISRRVDAPPDSKAPQVPYARFNDFADKFALNRGGSTRPVAFASSAMLRDAVAATHDYEPLTGGTGREIYYRQARFTVADLLGKHNDIEHYVEFSSLSGAIIDFGINGLAFSLKEAAPARDTVVEGFRVVIGNDTLYQGRALIRYCRPEANSSTTVGVVLLDGILDTDAMVMAKNRALAARTAASLSETLRAGVSQQYKEAMADLVLLLSSYRQLLDSQERSILTLSAPSARERAEGEVLDIAIAEFGAQYDRYKWRCNELTRGLTGASKRAYRQYTEAVLHPYVLSAPLAHHCYNKPLGYPGDYMLMSYLYDPQPYGTTLYDKLIHEVVCRHEPMGNGVVRRKDFLLGQIRSVMASVQSCVSLPCRVLSLACGPAQEVLEFATQDRDSCAPVVFTLIDQDQRSLTHANSYLSRLLIPGSTNIVAKYLYMGFMQMIRELDAFDTLPEQDLIYAAGLFDYIKLPTARRLAQRLFRKLRQGGKLVIGNFKWPNDSTWCLEYWMDWHLIYRDRDDMRAITEFIDEPHSVELTCDDSGYTYMLMITRG